jgi:uncharacterized membrane protein YgaE (UPF0421/DUF939 family)
MSGRQGGGAGTLDRTPPTTVGAVTDDDLTHPLRARTLGAWLRDGTDRLAGADPGLIQLRMALQAVLGIAVGLGLAYLFIRLTGALQLPAGSAPGPTLSAVDHELLVVSMLLAGMVALQATFVVQDRTARGQLAFSLFLPVPMTIALVLGLLLGSYRLASLAYLVVAMAVAVYLRRWGPRGQGTGTVLFFGAFLGFFLQSVLTLRDAGWIAVDLWIGVLASLLVRFALFPPKPEGTLARMRRTHEARARRLITLSARVLADDDETHVRALDERIRRQLVRLNETRLMIEAHLAETRPRTASIEAQRLFDAELALSNSARFATALATGGAPPTVRRPAATALSALLEGPHAVSRAVAALRTVPCAEILTSVQVSRLAASVELYAEAHGGLDRPVDPEAAEAAGGTFTPAVELQNGWLPGSVPVSTEVSTTRGRGLLDRVPMPPYLRATVQITVAGTVAVAVGDAVSAHRLYFAVLATFLSFLMATNTGEQARRALFRTGGTAIGIVVGDLLVHLTGGHVWSSLAIVLVAMFFGVYLIRLNYMFLVVAITVTISQLYVQIDVFSWQLLLLRLAETAIGSAAVIVTVLFILPLRPQRVLTVGMLLWVTSLQRLLDAVFGRLDGQHEPLRPLIRAVDATYAELVATAAPLRWTTFGRRTSRLPEMLSISSAVRQYARSLAAAVEGAEADGEALPWADAPLRPAVEQLRTSVDAVAHRLDTGENGRYVRSSALVALTLDRLRRQPARFGFALKDLTHLDGALAQLATALQMQVDDHDTAGHGGDASDPSDPAVRGLVDIAEGRRGEGSTW